MPITTEIGTQSKRNLQKIGVTVICLAILTGCGKAEIPNRLSCAGSDIPPDEWESGAIHFDFSKGIMLLKRSHKMYLGSARREDRTRTIFFDKMLIADTGRTYPVKHWVSVSPMDGARGGGIRVKVTSSIDPEITLTCLGMNE
jgi:hypothetical protein